MSKRSSTWIFASGSLMWNSGFNHLEERPALLRGYHRAFCIYSLYAWGNEAEPGLVLGLLPGGSCRGHALRVGPAQTPAVLEYLDDRESAAYRRVRVPVMLGQGQHLTEVQAYTYIANRQHSQFAGKLPLERAAKFIRRGKGHRGTSVEYLQNTVRHLDEFGVNDGPLHRLLDLVSDR